MSKIPLKYACIFFNRHADRSLAEITVLDRRIVPSETKPGDVTSRFNSTHGAFSRAWGTGNDPIDHPAGVFASVVLAHPPTPEVLQQALDQFSRIEGCEWAEVMLAQLQRRDIGSA